jgi:neurotransmitter:Na+ symporter, NSS family
MMPDANTSMSETSNHKRRRGSFRNRIAFYLLAIGSACGLGNIWRFPYVVGENGGGAFLLVYIFLSLTVGLSVLIAELIMGRTNEASLLKITRKVSVQTKKPFFWFGRLSLFISLVILAYYSVISGWVLHFLTQFLVGLFRADRMNYLGQISMNVLNENGLLQFALASVHLLICGFIVLRGVTERFEKILTAVLPLFGILVFLILTRSLSLPSSPEVLRFLFYPDFSKLNLTSLGHAMGHVLFTLSLGMGVLVTFGSYFKEDEHLPTLGVRVTLVDTIISIVAVLMIFPIAFSISNKPLTDPSLLFEALPQLFLKIEYGEYFGLAFFLCLWIAALNASIALLETLISNLSDRFQHANRFSSAWLVILVTLFLTVFPAFSGTLFKNLKVMNQSLIENLDSVLINYLLPISVLGMIIIFFKSINEIDYKEKFVNESSESSQMLVKNWIWVLKWLAPCLIILGLILQFFSVIKNSFLK